MNIDYRNYSHLSFDLWLTLIRSNPEFKKRRNLLFKDFFEIDSPIDKVSQVVRYYDVMCNNINEKTGLNLSTYEIYYLILGALEVNLETNGLEKLGDFYNETESLFFDYKPELIFSETKSLFKEITNQEKSINILSNTGFIKGKTLRKLIDHFELTDLISFQIYSDEVGFSKPNKEIFQLVLNQVNDLRPVEKNEILHIGDNSIADYNGAVSFGFGAHLLKI
ncbi:HAD-IA family hydrolase [Flavobacterium foetidum]|nr:HAD-IA family hydrolase [Flavobacterium foetidum]